MEIIEVKVSELNPAPYNPRQMTEKQVLDLDKSIDRFGFVEPIVVNRHKGRGNIVVGGHQRLKIAISRGMTTIPVVYVDLDEKNERELNLRLNKNNGEWDWDALAEFDRELLLDAGFDDKDLNKYFQLDTVEDEAPEPRPDPNVNLGDLFQLGNHRLLCGDATSKEDVERLMDGQKADMVFTSPPYNVGIDYSTHDDKLSSDDYSALITNVAKQCFDFMGDGRLMAWNVGVSPKSAPHRHMNILEDVGFSLYRHIVWKKTGAQIPLWQNSIKDPRARHYMPNYNHELVYLVSKGEVELGSKTQMPNELSMDVWDVSQFSAGGHDHPAAFPVKLAGLAISAMTGDTEAVYDPFGGSGSTLIACEQLNRKCYMMEIDPQYVRVIIDRWEKLTGQKAQLSQE